MRRQKGQLSIEGARRGIYLDFEGFVQESPSLAGVAIDGDFEQIILDERLLLAADEKELRRVPLSDLVDEIIEECIMSGRHLIAFSCHEQDQIRRYTKIEVSDIYVNALKVAKQWKRRIHPSIDLPKNSFDAFLTLPGVDYKVPKHLGKGNATKRLRAVIDMLERKGSYASLTPTTKAKWTKLLDYNRHDVLGLRALMLRAAADLEDAGRNNNLKRT